MDDFLTHVFTLSLLPITSQSAFVIVPGMFAFIYGCCALVVRFMRGL